MPSQPVWFHRLEEIFTLLQGIEATHLDRTRRQMTAHDVGEWPVEDLLETITLGPGKLRIVFDGGYWTWRPGCWSCPRQ